MRVRGSGAVAAGLPAAGRARARCSGGAEPAGGELSSPPRRERDVEPRRRVVTAAGRGFGLRCSLRAGHYRGRRVIQELVAMAFCPGAFQPLNRLPTPALAGSAGVVCNQTPGDAGAGSTHALPAAPGPREGYRPCWELHRSPPSPVGQAVEGEG